MMTLRWCIFVIIFLFAILSCADALTFFNVQRYGEFPRMLAMRSEEILNNATSYLNKEKLNRTVRSADDVKTDNIIVQDNLVLDNNSKSNDVKINPNANNSKEFTVEKDKDKTNNEIRRLLFERTDTNITSKQIQETNHKIKEIPLNNIDNKRRLILLRVHPSEKRYVKRIIYITGKNNLKPESDFRQLIDEPPHYGSEIHTIKRDQLNNVGGGNAYADLKGLLEESQKNQIGVQYNINQKGLPFSSKISLQKQNGFNLEQRHLAYSKEGYPTKYVKLNYNDYPRLIHVISKMTGGKYVDPSMISKHATTTYSPSTTNEELDYETIVKMFKEPSELNKQEPSELKKIKLYQILQNSNPKKKVKFGVPIKTTNLDAYDDEEFLQDWSTYKENLKSDEILPLFEEIDNTRKNVDSVNEEISASVKNSTENEYVESRVVPATTENPDPSYSKEVQVVYSLENPSNKQKSDNLDKPSLTVIPIESNNLETNQQAQKVFMETNNVSINDQYKDTPSQSSLVTIMDKESKTYKGDNVVNSNARIKLPDDLNSTITKKLCTQANDKLLEAWDLIIQTFGLNAEDNDEKKQKDITDTFIDIAMQRDFNELTLQEILEKFLKKLSTEHPEDKEKQAVRARFYDLSYPGQGGSDLHLYDAQSQHRYGEDNKNKLLKYYNPVSIAHGENSRAVKREMSIALANLLKQLSNDPYTSPDEIVPSLLSYLTSNFNLSVPQNYCELKKYLKLVEGFKQLVDDYYSNKLCVNGAVVAKSDKIMLGHELPTFDSQE